MVNEKAYKAYVAKLDAGMLPSCPECGFEESCSVCVYGGQPREASWGDV